MSTYRVRLFAMMIILVIFTNVSIAEIHIEPNKRGTLIIVGGGDTPYTIQKRFIELAGGAGKARIAIFQMASTGDDEEADEVLAEFKLLGAESVILNLDRSQAESEAMDVMLSGFTGYWFLGGDQNLLAASLLGTRALRRIEYRYERGAVVGGTSAGASVMTATMLT